ncbi:hypothetical protein [Chitinophaga rhizophila]|uniref:Uncharacterized protein n=1 Tax=Chitinophaga rhizophila TaxID=2866212 RepID=A0ABS7GHU4_9BACT|nr:hypothetical protein [Chitinophaga rhizophila]MBW8686222.1 hypothetical protein [Chitinophaga rhizophila]
MFRAIPIVCLIWLTFNSSCNNSPKPAVVKETKSINIGPIVPDSVMQFYDFINGLAQLKLPYPNAYELKEVKDYAHYLGNVTYQQVKAGRFSTTNGITPVIYECEISNYEKRTWLVMYNDNAQEVSRLQIAADVRPAPGQADADRSTAVKDTTSTQFTSQWYAISQDSLIEVKGRHSTYVATSQQVSTTIHFYRIGATGEIKEVSREKESFETYAGHFPEKKLPATIDTVNILELTAISHQTPYYDFRSESQDPLYAMARLEIPGRATALLYARDTIYLDEGLNYPEVKLITYKKDKEVDKMVIYGGTLGDHKETVYRKCTVEKDASINLQEEDNRVVDKNFRFRTVYNMQYEILPGGKIVGRQATSIVHSSKLYNEKALMKYFKAKRSGHHYISLFNIRAKANILVGLHAFTKGEESFLEFVTVNKDNKIIDRHTVYDHLKKQKTADIKAKKMENTEADYNDRRGRLTCDAIIKLTGRELHITPGGKFVK